jgi:hypothetical protein
MSIGAITPAMRLKIVAQLLRPSLVRNVKFADTSGAKMLHVEFAAVLNRTTVKNGDLFLIHHQSKVGL